MLYGGCRLFVSEEEFCGALCAASTMVQRLRLAHIALREGSFVSLSVLGAILFLNHQILYMAGDGPSSLSWQAYAASTVVIYGFLRGIFFVGGMRVPRVGARPDVCPECGQPLEGGTPLRHSRGDVRTPSQTPHSTPPGLRVALLRPILIPAPSRPRAEEGINARLDSLLLQKLARSPPASRLMNSAEAVVRQGERSGLAEPGADR